ncbi:MAG: hypothetical protein SV062_03865 [Thermodesulfobacteriota bacterium]|nr:hypothetical protein [Thermodesulfobacteriota bacterium]
MLKKETGIALVTALFFLLFISMAWFTFSSLGPWEAWMVKNQLESGQAAYLAETGIQQALWRLEQDWDWRNWGGSLPSSAWSGSHGSDVDGNYYEWNGNLGDDGQSYLVKIRDNGIIKDKIVSTGTADSSSRTVELELASAFDYGLYSYGQMEFKSRSFSVAGDNINGYVYSKDNIIDSSGFLSADKITGKFQGGPGNFFFFPKKIPMPELNVTSYITDLNSYKSTMDTYIQILELFSFLWGDNRSTIDDNLPFNNNKYFNNPSGITIRGDHSFLAPYAVGFKYAVDIGGSWGGIPNSQTTIDAGKTVVVKGNAVIRNRLVVNGRFFINGNLNIYDNIPGEHNGITIGSGGLLYIGGNLHAETKHHDSNDAFLVNGGLYVKGDIFIDNAYADDVDRYHCVTVNNTVFANANFEITDDVRGNEASAGRGLIVINNPTSTAGTMDHAAIFGDDILNNNQNHPLFILVINDLLIKDGIGALENLYGFIYNGGKLSRTEAGDFSKISPTKVKGGGIIASDYGDLLTGGAITYRDFKSQLYNLGFTDNKDYVRPVLWKEEN